MKKILTLIFVLFTFESIANDVASIRAFITEEIIWYEKTWSEEEQKQKMAEEDGF